MWRSRKTSGRLRKQQGRVLHSRIGLDRMVGVAQWLERRTVAPEAAGSSPVIHPTSLG